MSDYTDRTKHDLDAIAAANQEIALQKGKIRYVKQNCVHENYKLDYIETFAYEFTPVKKCVVCGHTIRTGLTEDEMYQLCYQWHDDIYGDEIEWDEEVVRKKMKGFNL